MAETTQGAQDEKRRAFECSLFWGNEIDNAIRTLNRDIAMGPSGSDISPEEAIQFAHEFNILLLRARTVRYEADDTRRMNSKARYDQLLRDMKHYCEVLERKD